MYCWAAFRRLIRGFGGPRVYVLTPIHRRAVSALWFLGVPELDRRNPMFMAGLEPNRRNSVPQAAAAPSPQPAIKLPAGAGPGYVFATSSTTAWPGRRPTRRSG